MNKEKTPAREKLKIWFNNPNIPDDAWYTLPYKKIAEHAGISEYAVRMNLPYLIAEIFNKEPTYCKEKRNEYATQVNSKGKRISSQTWAAIHHARYYEKKSVYDISIAFRVSYRTLIKYFKEYEKGKESLSE